MRRVIQPERENKRYVLVQTLLHKPKYSNLKHEIKKNFEELFGGIGLQQSQVRLIKNLYDEKKGQGLIVVNRKNVNDLKFSLLFLRKVKNKDVIIKTSKVYGTIKKYKLHNKIVKEEK